ncbi:RNA-binding protein [Angomonas deanei]|nr:RNA-binding protein [Angomonas deanei]|eukprot:EPY42044.1 RNA-binding protein [Angomonas deanei]
MFKTDENNRKKDAHHHDEPATDENGEIIGSSAFVSYATTKEADSAILSLHDKYSMDGRGRRLQVSYCLKTDKISTFGYQHAMRLHALNPATRNQFGRLPMK